jgi:hypothetical protein
MIRMDEFIHIQDWITTKYFFLTLPVSFAQTKLQLQSPHWLTLIGAYTPGTHTLFYFNLPAIYSSLEHLCVCVCFPFDATSVTNSTECLPTLSARHSSWRNIKCLPFHSATPNPLISTHCWKPVCVQAFSPLHKLDIGKLSYANDMSPSSDSTSLEGGEFCLTFFSSPMLKFVLQSGILTTLASL